jgi:hypothetical protein
MQASLVSFCITKLFSWSYNKYLQGLNLGDLP